MFLAKEISTSALLDEWSTVNSAINDHCNMSNRLIHFFFLFVILFILNQRESGNTTYNACNITELITNGTELFISKTIYNTHSTY